MEPLRLIQLLFAFTIFFGIIVLMIGKKTNANVSLMWLLIAIGVMILGFFPQIIDVVSDGLGIDYPPTLIIVIAIAAILWITFYVSSELAVAQTKIRELAMQISLLNNEAATMKDEKADKKDETN